MAYGGCSRKLGIGASVRGPCSEVGPIVASLRSSLVLAMRFRMGGLLDPRLSVGLLPIMRTTGNVGRLGLDGLASASVTQRLPTGAEVVLILESVEPERPTFGDMAERWRPTPAERRLLRALVADHTVWWRTTRWRSMRSRKG